MQIETTAELTQTLEDESNEPSKAKNSGRAQRVRTYRQRHADGDQDSDAEELLPSTKRNKTEFMNLNNALKQARKKKKLGEKLTLFEERILQDEKDRQKTIYRKRKNAEFLSKPMNQTPIEFYNQMDQLKQEMLQMKT